MAWFQKKTEQPKTQMDERYQGKPLLILLENYVLDCIGELPQSKVPNLISIVQRVYGGGEDWKATLRSVLHLESSIDEGLRGLWARNQEIAKQANIALSADDFARMVVDENFSEGLR
jgi:hypothetical protein